MLRTSKSLFGRRAALGFAGAAVLLAGLPAAPASAAEIKVSYPVSGTSMVKKTGSALELGPGTLAATVTTKPGGGDVKGVLNLPPAHASFAVAGLIPVQATVTVLPTGPATGEIKQGVLTSRAEFDLKLSDIWVGGIFPIPVGGECKTEQPVSVDLKSEGAFTVFGGGAVAGSYTIPDFENCTIFAPILSPLISGPDNTIKLTLGKPTPIP
ncbi:hypothetical protein [Amycolatopsis nigrescens]|uniref:hypothetical protein n=1 Tax=Amycolatopsis nigrescens TaxID=381445 RepID=UPI0003A71B31|nr:hypothetical protein [Amycolatopsis nigrescens]